MKQLTKLEKIIGAGIFALSLATGYVAREGQVQRLKEENASVNAKYEEALKHHSDFIDCLPNYSPSSAIAGGWGEKEMLADIQHYYKLGMEYSLKK